MYSRLAATLLTLAALAPATAGAGGLPSLALATPFVLDGETVTLSLQGEPGAAFTLLSAQTPAEVPLGQVGTLFLKQSGITPVGSGVLDGGGAGSLPFLASGSPGTLRYLQAVVFTASGARLSNAVVLRIQTALPAGRRVSLAVAAAPDGTKAYVANQVDGSVSVIDAVNDVKLKELPITVPAAGIPHRALDLAIDPEGRHLFVVSAAADRVAVVDVASDSVAAQLVVPRGCRRIAFDFGGTRRIYITNEVINAVVVFEEGPAGGFTRRASIPLEGDDPGPLLVLPDGRLVIGQRVTHEIEVVDPLAAPGQATVARTDIQGLPFDLALANGELLIPTFVPSGMPGVEGFNRLLRVELGSFQINDWLFEDVGTDYVALAADDTLMAIVAASTGTVLLADPVSGALLDNVELAPAAPTATPQDAALIAGPGGPPAKVYVVNYFRETVRAIGLEGGPPFTLGAEIPLAWSGQPRVPLSGDLSAAEDGDWFLRSVQLFGGGPFNPNRVTCFTCHVDGASDNITRVKQAPPIWGTGDTAPYGTKGNSPELLPVITGAMNGHNSLGTPPFPGAENLLLEFFTTLDPPASVFLGIDGSLSQAAQAGKALFEGAARCSTCHSAPIFIPVPPIPLTIQNGIGTGLVPANVPSLRGAWATAPYLHNGSASTLMGVLTINPDDTHGRLAAPLTEAQRRQLVEYLKTL